MILEGLFREDLFYRLNIYPIEIPSLSQRKSDIPVLVEYFYKIYAQQFKIDKGPKISYPTLNFLVNYPWQGNVRQIRHAVERAFINAIELKKKELDFSFLDLLITKSATENINKTKIKDKHFAQIAEIKKALEKSKGKIQGRNSASEILGLAPSTLRSRMKKFGIA